MISACLGFNNNSLVVLLGKDWKEKLNEVKQRKRVKRSCDSYGQVAAVIDILGGITIKL